MADQAPRSSAAARRHLIRSVGDELASHVDQAEITTRVMRNGQVETVVQMRYPPMIPIRSLRAYDAEAVNALRKLPGAHPSIPLGSPSRAYSVWWDGVRAPV